VGAKLAPRGVPTMDDNDNALILDKRGVFEPISSKLAPTGIGEKITKFVFATADHLPQPV
jgi:hypothetical protein